MGQAPKYFTIFALQYLLYFSYTETSVLWGNHYLMGCA